MEVLNHILSWLCHQDAARSFSWAGWTAPLCHRCAGVYVGFLLGAAFAAAAPRRPRGFGPWPVVAWNVAALAQMAVFGFHLVGQGVGARFTTGLVFGGALAWLAAPVFWNYVLGRPTRSWRPADLGAYAAIVAATIAAGLAAPFWVRGPVVAIVAVLAVAGAAAAYSLVNVTLVFWLFGGPFKAKRSAIAAAAGLGLAALEVGALGLFRAGAAG